MGSRVVLKPTCLCDTEAVSAALDLAAIVRELSGPAPENGNGHANGAAHAPKLKPYDVATMVETNPPPVPWVVKGLVVQGCLTVLNGREGEGKSLLTMALAAGVALGEAEAGMDCALGRAAIVDAENGEWEFHRRVHSIGLPRDVLAFEADGLDLRRDLAELERVLAEHSPDLLILDSFRSLWRGDENDAREASEVLDALRNLIRRYGTGTILLHHSGKGVGASYRGSSAIGASAELGFTLARAEEDKQRERRYLHCWKCRPAPEPDTRWVSLRAADGRVYVDEAEPFEADALPDAPVREELKPLVLAALTNAPQSRADIARAVDRAPKDRSVGRVLDELSASGQATRTPAGGWQRSSEPLPGTEPQTALESEGGRVAGWQAPIGGVPPATPDENGA